MPSRRCARSPGKGAIWWSASRPESRSCRSTSPCSRAATCAACSGAPSRRAIPRPMPPMSSKLFRLWDEGKIAPEVSATYPLERGGEAIAAMARAQGDRQAGGRDLEPTRLEDSGGAAAAVLGRGDLCLRHGGAAASAAGCPARRPTRSSTSLPSQRSGLFGAWAYPRNERDPPGAVVVAVRRASSSWSRRFRRFIATATSSTGWRIR